MASPCEQRIDDAVSAEKDDEEASTAQELETQSTHSAGNTEKSDEGKEERDTNQIQDISMETDDVVKSGKTLTADESFCNDETQKQAVQENHGTDDLTKEEEKDKEGKDDDLKDEKGLCEPSLLSMVKGSTQFAEREEAELLGLDETQKQVTETIDEESEKALLTDDNNDQVGHKRNECEEENMDTSESFVAEKLQQPQHFGEKEVSETNSRHDADSEVEIDMKRANTIHLPESVYNIDEETRMGLDQTPSETSMTSSILTPLPPKKLFHLDDTKDSVDSETKMSANTDTEDIRLRNTLSVDQENTKDSVASDSVAEGPTPSKRSRGYREGLGDVIALGETKHFTAETLFEYQWPQDGGEWHMLQEQISEFLKVKSFKRKYPDLYRRVCDKEEKDFLREKGVVTETQSDLGLTALRSEEVYDLMMKDYNDRYQEYLTVLQEKQKRVMREKHKEYGVAKLDKSKMEAYSKKAARLAAEFNASLMREKREERQAYFDLQTYTIHHTKNRFRSLPPGKTKIGSYPVALITGQYQDKFRRYQPEELRNFPLKTALVDPPTRVKYLLKPPASLMKPVETPVVEVPDVEMKAVGTEDLESQEEDRDKENIGSNDQEAAEVSSLIAEPDQADATFKFDKRGKLVSAKKLTKGAKLSGGTPEKGRKLLGGKKKEETNEEDGVADAPKQIHGLEKCRICKQRSSKEDRIKDRLIRCAQCHKIGHMSCLDLTDELVAVIKTYPWQCMECKACVQCMDPYDEDKMMFCDRCDRGYHTFCIGLEALPTGHWECRSCVDRKPDELPGDGNREEINSHNVIKDENQDSQDSMVVKESPSPVVKGAGGRWTREILDTKPLSENELTTEYLMRLAGRNTNWRKDTGTEEKPERVVPSSPLPPPPPSALPHPPAAALPPPPPPPHTPITPVAPVVTPVPPVATTPAETTTMAPTSTPAVVKKGRRKRSEMNLNPTRSRPDRAQGARQSRRIKAREEEEDDKKKDEDEEPKKKKKKKKEEEKEKNETFEKRAVKAAESMEIDDGDDVKNEKDDVDENDEEDVNDNDKGSDEVLEGVDDSEMKEVDDSDSDDEDEDELEDEEEDKEDDLEEFEETKDSQGQDNEDGEGDVEKDGADDQKEDDVAEELAVQDVDEEETASATDILLQLIDGPSVEMEQEQQATFSGSNAEVEQPPTCSDSDLKPQPTSPDLNIAEEQHSTSPDLNIAAEQHSTRPESNIEAEQHSTGPESNIEAEQQSTGPESNIEAEQQSTGPESNIESEQHSTVAAVDHDHDDNGQESTKAVVCDPEVVQETSALVSHDDIMEEEDGSEKVEKAGPGSEADQAVGSEVEESHDKNVEHMEVEDANSSNVNTDNTVQEESSLSLQSQNEEESQPCPPVSSTKDSSSSYVPPVVSELPTTEIKAETTTQAVLAVAAASPSVSSSKPESPSTSSSSSSSSSTSSSSSSSPPETASTKPQDPGTDLDKVPVPSLPEPPFSSSQSEIPLPAASSSSSSSSLSSSSSSLPPIPISSIPLPTPVVATSSSSSSTIPVCDIPLPPLPLATSNTPTLSLSEATSISSSSSSTQKSTSDIDPSTIPLPTD